MIEIPLSIIAQVIFYGIGIGILFHTTKWIVTGLNDGYHFDIKSQDDFFLVLTLDAVAIGSILAALHFGDIIKIV